MPDSTITRWGILATGGIARTFARNLLQYSPNARGASDVVHKISAVASSSSLASAQSFIDANVTPYQPPDIECAPHSSYLSLIQSPSIDVVYIATPHSYHFSTAMLALSHDKPVLCEKPLCVNAVQAAKLVECATKRRLFMMEAVWTRFFPISIHIRELIKSGVVGEVLRISADFSMGAGDDEGVERMFGGDDNRILNKDLAGGVLLDLGIYSLTWIFQCVYHTLSPTPRQSPTVKGLIMTPHPRTGADESTTLLMELCSAPSGTSICHATASTSLRCDTNPGSLSVDADEACGVGADSLPFARIQGTFGEIQVFGNAARPQAVKTLVRNSKSSHVADATTSVIHTIPYKPITIKRTSRYTISTYHFPQPGDGNGMYYEADECARCLRDGKTQSEIMPWTETLEVLKVMDEVRRRGGLTYSKKMESAEWAG